jgi:methyl-accepting chemotaxis protein
LIWIQASYNPILDTNGRIVKVVKYATDMTPIIQAGNMAEEAVGNAQSVAAAVEEMSASVAEISKNMAMSRDAASGIMDDTAKSSAAAEQLTSSMKTMENIVQLINGIAGQVNLLALNATIEAARAGEAGKGFAVVAAEVKNLANQTTGATEDISKQIQELQGVALNVAQSVNSIAASAGSVNQYVAITASAVEEQSAVTREISGNTQKMATSEEDIAQRIKRLSSK